MIGHRDTDRTACPGDALYAQLDELRALVASGDARSPGVRRTRERVRWRDSRVDYGAACR